MSKFRIYTSKRISFKRIEQLNRALYISSTILPLAGILIVVGDKLNFSIYFPIAVLVLWALVVIALIFFSRFVRKSLKSIGYLNVSANNMQKKIGDFSTSKKYEELKEIKIKKHLGSLLFTSNQDGSKTYLLSIRDKNNETEQLVISSQSDDWPENNFYDLMKKIQKRTKIKLSN